MPTDIVVSIEILVNKNVVWWESVLSHYPLFDEVSVNLQRQLLDVGRPDFCWNFDAGEAVRQTFMLSKSCLKPRNRYDLAMHLDSRVFRWKVFDVGELSLQLFLEPKRNLSE